MATITTLTLTLNEENNIKKCLASVKGIADKMIVLDGFSKDKTVELARSEGAEVRQKDCGYFDRFQFGMETIRFDTDWVLFIDADERLTPVSSDELKKLCDQYADSDVNGIVVNYRVNFMGKELKYGASVLKKLRVFKPGMAFMEDVILDQHIRLKAGKIAYMKSFLLHEDDKGLVIWSQKHIKYAQMAAEDYLKKSRHQERVEVDGLEKSAKIKRVLKYGVYYRIPSGLRAWCFYFYRYYLRLGFLDGKEGKIYTFLHAYWYRFLVDAMIENQKRMEERNNL
ncbi:MAG: glycosyltransferase family 2 protein [Lachnospiraceae bacterium]|nr:glycosyltransferase family 2 protein [Lachnospiraceae bacterium]